jgi:hypothetical protein
MEALTDLSDVSSIRFWHILATTSRSLTKTMLISKIGVLNPVSTKQNGRHTVIVTVIDSIRENDRESWRARPILWQRHFRQVTITRNNYPVIGHSR